MRAFHPVLSKAAHMGTICPAPSISAPEEACSQLELVLRSALRAASDRELMKGNGCDG
jgi:hypothetical protein